MREAAGASCVALAGLGCCVQHQLRSVAAGAACDNSLRWRWAGGAALSVAICRIDSFLQGLQPRLGVPRDPRLHVVKQLLAFKRAVGNGPTKRGEPQCPCPVCPPLFPRSVDRGRSFDLSRLPTADEASAMVVRALSHVGFDTALFPCISARRGGLSSAIEAGRARPTPGPRG